MAGEYIFTMQSLRKVHPPNKEILKASTCRSSRAPRSASSARTARASPRCCASWPGVDKDFVGEARPRRRHHASATCRRSRSSTRRRTCAATSRRRSRRHRGLLAPLRRDQRPARRGHRRPTRWRSCSTEQGKVQDEIERRERLGARPQARDRDGRAARCRPATPTSTHALRRRAAPRRALPAAAAAARHAAARRADQPPRRRERGLARAASCRSTRARSSPSPTTATSSTTSPAGSSSSTAAQGIPWEGNYSSWLEQKQERLRAGGEGRVGAPASTLARELEWVRMARRAPGRPRARRASPPTRSSPAQEARQRDESDRDQIPPGPRLGDLVVEAEGLAQGLRRPPADRGPELPPAAAAASSASSAPTAPARPRCSA